jgi:hypothetical protein
MTTPIVIIAVLAAVLTVFSGVWVLCGLVKELRGQHCPPKREG